MDHPPPRISVLQPMSLTEWSLPVDNFAGLQEPDCIGRFLLSTQQGTVHCPQPILFDRLEEAAFFMPRGKLQAQHEFPLPDVRLDTVPQARLVSDKFVVLSRDQKVFSESYWSDANLHDGTHFQRHSLRIAGRGGERKLPLVLFRESPIARRIEGAAMLIGNPWAANYHHWLINALLRLWWTSQFAELQDIPLIVPASMSPFQQESLAALGVDPRRLLPFDGALWQIDRLFFPANGDYWPLQLRWLRQRCFEHYRLSDAPGQRRIYISRADAPGRRVTNEPEVIEMLERRGFEVLELAALPLAEQVRAFAEAKLIVGPHGAGLTNIVFAASNATVVDLHPRDEINHALWVEASALGLKYALLTCAKMNDLRDLRVSVTDLATLLDRLE
jgi:capsular polysaccharide biosynthesis protein